MNNSVPAPDSEFEFVKLLLSGKTVFQENTGVATPLKLISRLKDKIEESEGVFEGSGLSLVFQAVLHEDLAQRWNPDFSNQVEKIGTLFWIEGL